jgi:hypothetical protein
MKRMRIETLVFVILSLACGFMMFNSDESWAVDTCGVFFDEQSALSNVFAQARDTFASPTGMAASGYPDVEQCTASHKACWVYRHRCFAFRDYVNVAPLNYGHFHLSFEDPAFTCFPPDPGDGLGGGFGRVVQGVCLSVNWVGFARALDSHDWSQWIRIWLEDRDTHTPNAFQMPIIRIGGNNPIKLYFRKTDGSWWSFSSLAPGDWGIGNWVNSVTEVLIRGAQPASGPYRIELFTIRK